jgi:hypothetical protein
MLSHLKVSEVTAIIDATSAYARDYLMMEEYLHPEISNGQIHCYSPAELEAEAQAGVYDSPEVRHLDALVENLSRPALNELIALMFVGRGDIDDFVVALRHAKSTSNEGDALYVARKPLHEYLPVALQKLGLQ